jgi:hypothetical protein
MNEQPRQLNEALLNFVQSMSLSRFTSGAR